MDSLEDIERFLHKGQEWLQKAHAEGLSGEEFGRSHSGLMDSLIRRLYKRAMNVNGERAKDLGFALLAMGGYGREELSPFSDIDLLLLHLPGKGKDLEDWLRAVLHPLWDWGLTVGYTVQTPQDSCRAAQKDLDLLLAFLDARWVAGDKGTFLRWEEEFSRSLLAGKDTELILQIRQRAEGRHAHFGDSVFVLEPEIKEGKGGLRDYHAAFWAARIKYHIRSAEKLTANFLNILSAQISTWENGIAVDLFKVQNLIDEPLFQPRRWTKLEGDLKKVLGGEVPVNSLVEGMVLPLFQRYPSPRRDTKVEVDNSASDFYTVVEVYTHDRPGLLYRVTKKIFEMNLSIWMARISTKVDQVVDVFYIQDLSGAKLEDEGVISGIKNGLIEELQRI